MHIRSLPKLALAILLLMGASPAKCELDYKNITPRDSLATIITLMRDGDAADRRIAADDVKEFAQKYVELLDTDPEAQKLLELAGAGLIELIHHGKATTRVRSERVLADMVGLLGEELKGEGQRRAMAKALLEKYSASLGEHPEHKSGSKIIEDIEGAFEEAGLTIAAAPPADLDGIIEPAPGKSNDEEPILEPQEQQTASTPAQQQVEGASQPVTQTEQKAQTQKQLQTPAQEKAPDQQEMLPTEMPVKVVTAPAGSALSAATPAPVVKTEPSITSGPESASSDGAKRKAPKVVSGPKKSSNTPSVAVVKAPERARSSSVEKVDASTSGVKRAGGSTISPVISIVLVQLASTDTEKLLGGLKLTRKSSESFLAWNENQSSDTRVNKLMAEVRSLLRHKDASVRQEAAMTSAALKDRLAVYPLIDLLRGGDDSVGDAASSALSAITEQDFGDDTAKWTEWADTELGQ